MGERLTWHARIVAVAVFVAVVGTASLASATMVGSAHAAHTSVPGVVKPLTVGVGWDLPGTYWEALDSANSAVFNGSLELDFTDMYAENDVLQCYLYAGEVITFSLNGAQGTDFGLKLYGPDALSIDLDAPLTMAGPNGQGSYPHTISSFNVPTTGLYYFDVYTWITDGGASHGGQGTYTLTATIEKAATSLSLNAVHTLPYYSGTTISGIIHSRDDDGVSGLVTLMASSNGTWFHPIASMQSANGTFSFDVPLMTQTMHYLVQYAGTNFYSPTVSPVTIPMTAYLTAPTAKRNTTRTYTMSGYIGSWHKPGTVRIYLWHYVSGKWKAASYRNAPIAGYFVLQPYSVKYKFPSTGKWKMQAYHADANHAATRSGFTAFTVK